jgi:dipeptidyl aminopeptidase/acylaminoacyl peptidase
MKRRQFVQGLSATTLGLSWAKEAGAFANERKTLPIQAFIEGPMLSDYSLSPDGKKLAMVVNGSEKSTLLVRDLVTGKTAAVAQTDNLESHFLWVNWVNDKRLLYSLGLPFVREQGDSAVRRVETLESRLFGVDADGSNGMNLVKKTLAQANQRYSGHNSFQQDRIIDWLPDDPDHVLLALDHDDLSWGTAVYKVDVNTGDRKIYEPPRSEMNFLCTDASHRVRVGVEHNQDKGRNTFWACDPEGNNWRKLAVDNGVFDAAAIMPLGFGLDPHILYVSSRVHGLEAIHTMDLREEKPKLVLKLSDPEFNMSGSLVHDPRGEAVGIRASFSGGSSRYYWDANYKSMQDQFDKILPNRWNTLADLSRYNGAFLLESEVPGLPSTLLVGSLVNGKLDLLTSQYPGLDLQRIAPRTHFQFKARDGFLLHAYLTLPRDAKPKKLPLVVMPHGGPQARDTDRFDDMAAFVADRGYAVLQVNYRGSSGYGWDYMKAGLRRCGLETQDDVTDGVKKLIDEGVVDPARISIVGWSFGGYAALNGVIKDPDLYRGAFAVAPVTSLLDWVSDWYSFGQREVLRQQIGDSKDDAEQLRATSPLYHADKIKVPVVLMHGTLDRQVEYTQSVKMEEALTKAGKPHKFISFERGDHALSHRPYLLRVYTELEKFLQETIGPGAAVET